MIFNTIQYTEHHNIEVRTTGQNCQEGWIQICCPFCIDNNFHLGYNMVDNYFNCWICGHHSIYDVIRKLIPREDPKKIIREYGTRTIGIKKKKEVYDNTIINVPGSEMKGIHKKYLRKRSFNPEDLEKKYGLLGTDHLGDYKFRIVAPIYFKDQIVSYQGRDVTGKQEQRYKACEKKNEIIHHKHILYNIDNCKNNFVVVVEGITNNWRLGDDSCGTFGKGYTKQQLYLLSKFKKVFVFFDPDEGGVDGSEKLCRDLDCVGVKTFNVTGETDPAEMDQDSADKFMNELRSRK